MVKKIRHGLELDQKQFGKLLGVNQQTVSNWESRKDEQIPRPGERKIRRFLNEKYGVKVGTEDSDDDGEDIVAAALAIAGAGLGALLAGPAGAALGGALGLGGGIAAAGAESKATLEVKCPWCQKTVRITGIDTDAEYECDLCEEVFKFKTGLGRAVRVTFKPRK